MKTTVNCMGTVDFTHKFTRMRKEQVFTVYPLTAESGDSITIQSDTRVGEIDLLTGKGVMSASHSSGAYFATLQIDIIRKKQVEIELDHEDLFVLRNAIRKTAGAEVGNNGMKVFTDNTGALFV